MNWEIAQAQNQRQCLTKSFVNLWVIAHYCKIRFLQCFMESR